MGKGVSCFKEDKFVEAMQHFNVALEIDSQCIEGLVARGALLVAFLLICCEIFEQSIVHIRF